MAGFSFKEKCMYYGIAGASVHVDYKMVYYDGGYGEFSVISGKEWYIISKFDGMTVQVTLQSRGNDDNRVIISALLAPLKQIEDGMIYDASVAAIETKLGFKIDKDIPANIGKIHNMVASKGEIRYDISIDRIIDINFIKEPEMYAEHIVDIHVIRINMVIDNKKNYIDISYDVWAENNNLAIEYARYMLLKHLYEDNWSPTLTLLKYKMFEDEMNPAASKPMMTPKKEHKGIDQLPALSEIVTNPVSKMRGALKSVIVNLNDAQGWTREQIADWVETLDIDISFRVKEEK
jgi:hypothetical protein